MVLCVFILSSVCPLDCQSSAKCRVVASLLDTPANLRARQPSTQGASNDIMCSQVPLTAPKSTPTINLCAKFQSDVLSGLVSGWHRHLVPPVHRPNRPYESNPAEHNHVRNAEVFVVSFPMIDYICRPFYSRWRNRSWSSC